ncbi:Pentatricopeptide repeat-containing protein [Melia azedarach]|uniref:Pentatricopeptide repeat-containing protein n=1 Tax=Melia azedarach TaxID=155640 RepID=A0ACC1YI50_MELAZ|nr:Pentatricopeptide repeat-containing protein [Melia azedarach]
MGRAPSSVLTFLRQIPRQNPNAQIRNLSVETQQLYTDIAKQVCQISRTKPRWEQALLSDFPSFNFNDTLFFRELLKHQNNVLLSIGFFHWLHSHYNFLPDLDSCNVLFDSLVEAKAYKAATDFLDSTGFSPNPDSLERYIQCLCEGGLIEEALGVFLKLKEMGVCGSIKTWNSALSGCIKAGRTDLIWKLYQDMIESGVVADVDAETVRYLIQAFCKDGKVSRGYELLRQVLDDGLDPGNVAFNKLISGFCREKNYGRVSELLRTMVARNCAPDNFTYEEVINGLCKRRKRLEAYRVFNDLKERGYAPDTVMYTTVIHGLSKMGWLGDARKLWFEMINKGLRPNEYTYNTLIHGYCKIGNFAEARKLYSEMCERGYRETTVTYNTMIQGLCLHGRMGEAYQLFEEMTQKGIVRDVITYNTLIQGFCKEGKIVDSTNLLKELLAHGLQPSTSSYTPLIEKLCQVGDVQEAKNLWNEMCNRGLEPMIRTHDYIIIGLCGEGYVVEAMHWLMEMLKSKLKPKQETFERLVQCLSQNGRLDDSLLVLDLMCRIGYALEEAICHSLVTKLCKENSHLVETFLGDILERN